jgi:hypothetical protein
MYVCVSENGFESASTIFLLDIGTGLMFLCLFVCLFLFLLLLLFLFCFCLFLVFYYYICIIFLFNLLQNELDCFTQGEHYLNYFTDDNWFPYNISHI